MNDLERQPRKVLHVLNGAAGGAALSTLGLIEVFRKQGIEACAVCHDGGTPQEREVLRQATDGATLFTSLYWWNKKIRSAAWKRPLIELRQLLRTRWRRRSSALVADFARRHGADLIHTNTLMTPEGGITARRLGLAHVWHVRELVGPGNPYRLPLEGPALGKYLALHCSKVVANSRITAEQLRAWLPEGLLEVVPNGIDIAKFAPRCGCPSSDRIVVAMVGSLTARSKQHGLFVEAAALVDRSLPIEWRIYGHDPSRGGHVAGDDYIDALHARIARHRLSDRFRWPGFIADPAQIMSEIDILVNPADNESFGRVIVEAMAAELPAVGVRGGGVGEIIDAGVTGLLARPRDPSDLALNIERLARDPGLCRSLGIAGRIRAIENYSLEACAAGILRVYRAAMARPLGAPTRHEIALPPSIPIESS